MRRIFAIMMACLFMVAVMAVLAAPAFAACCVVTNKAGKLNEHGKGEGLVVVHKNDTTKEMKNKSARDING